MKELEKEWTCNGFVPVKLVLGKHVELMDVLSETSKFYCGQFAFDGLTVSAQLSPEVVNLIAEASALQITAAAAGRASPVVRQDPSHADWDSLSQRMLDLGTTFEELEVVYDGKTSSLSKSRKCEIGRDLYEGLASLPAEPAARLGAFLLIPDAQGGV